MEKADSLKIICCGIKNYFRKWLFFIFFSMSDGNIEEGMLEFGGGNAIRFRWFKCISLLPYFSIVVTEVNCSNSNKIFQRRKKGKYWIKKKDDKQEAQGKSIENGSFHLSRSAASLNLFFRISSIKFMAWDVVKNIQQQKQHKKNKMGFVGEMRMRMEKTYLDKMEVR